MDTGVNMDGNLCVTRRIDRREMCSARLDIAKETKQGIADELFRELQKGCEAGKYFTFRYDIKSERDIHTMDFLFVGTLEVQAVKQIDVTMVHDYSMWRKRRSPWRVIKDWWRKAWQVARGK